MASQVIIKDSAALKVIIIHGKGNIVETLIGMDVQKV